MNLAWKKLLPTWARVICTLFGLSILVGGLIGPVNWIIPSVIMGGAWTVVGIKGGLPAIDTVTAKGSSDPIADGLRKIRWRSRRAWLAILALVVLCFVALPRVAPQDVGSFFFIVALPVALLSVVSWLSSCPRCGHFFYPVGRLVSPFTRRNRCQNCGLKLRGGESENHAA